MENRLSFTSTTIKTEKQDRVTLLGHTVPGLPKRKCDEITENETISSPTEASSKIPEQLCEKKHRKGSKKMAIKGLKQGSSNSEDSFTIGMLTAGKEQQPKMQAGYLTPSLLEEVLNEKKRALLTSPEVISTLQSLQTQVQQNQEKDRKKKESNARRSSSKKDTTHKDPINTNKNNQSIWSKEGSAFTSVSASNS